MSASTPPPLDATDEPPTTTIDATDAVVPPSAAATSQPLMISIRLRPLEVLRTVPRVTTWIGLVLCAVGAIVLLFAWRQVAGMTDVGLQMPYVISGGLISLALLIVGLLLVALDALASESARRREQLAELRHLVGLLAEGREQGR